MIDVDGLDGAGQAHLVDAVERLHGDAKDRLIAQINALDLPLIATLLATVAQGETPVELEGLNPPDVVAVPSDPSAATERHAREAGEQRLRDGKVAAVLLAGGQGTRLGFDGPKGTFACSPVTGTTLFAHHAARITALRRRYMCELPWYIMTSPQNDAETRAFFAANDWFGLPAETITIFQQGVLPAVDRETGEILLERPDAIALSPDGHGGLFPALGRNGVLDDMDARGITTFLTYNVDNPIGRVGRPEFVGYHHTFGSEMSNVVVRKRTPHERVGVVAKLGDRSVLVEYSDLPAELASATEPDGSLRFWAGSVASHAIECAFARRVTGGLPYHRAFKRVPFVDQSGRLVDPDTPNAIKFETFMFDALPLATATLSVESLRHDEFSPIKNADGEDSPATARRDMNRLYARWLRQAGVMLDMSPQGDPSVDIEIDPTYALDADELRDRLPQGFSPAPGKPIVLR